MARSRRHKPYSRRVVDSDSDDDSDAEFLPPGRASGSQRRSPVVPRGEPFSATSEPLAPLQPTQLLPSHPLDHDQIPAQQAGPSSGLTSAQTSSGKQQKTIIEDKKLEQLIAGYFDSGKTHPPRGPPYWACGIPGCGGILKSTGLFDVKRHLRTHLPESELPYACRRCHTRYAQKHNCLAHERTHDHDKFQCDIIENGVDCDFQWTDPSARTHHRQIRHAWLTREEGCMARLMQVWLPRTRATQSAWNGRDRIRPQLTWPSASYDNFVVPTFPPSQQKNNRSDLAPQSQPPPDSDVDMDEGDATFESRSESPSPSFYSRRSSPPQAGPSRLPHAHTHRASSGAPSSSSADQFPQFTERASSMMPTRLPSFGEFVSRSSVPPPEYHHHSPPAPAYPHHSEYMGMPPLDSAQYRYPRVPPQYASTSASSSASPASEPRLPLIPPIANFPRHIPNSTTSSLSPPASPQLSEPAPWSVPCSVAYSPPPYPPWYAVPSGSTAEAASRQMSLAYDLTPVDSWSPRRAPRVYDFEFVDNDSEWSESMDESDWSEPSSPEANAKGKGKMKSKGKGKGKARGN